MADDIKIKYGSTGFERVAKELSSLEKQAGGAANWFKPMQSTLRDAESAGNTFGSKFTHTLESVGSFAEKASLKIALIGMAVTAVAGVVTVLGVAAFSKWTSSILKTTESYKMLEISLYGVTRSWETVAKWSKFATQYAAEYPAMYEDVMKAVQAFGFVPALKPMIARGDIEGMKEIMHIIQGLMAIRPEGGPEMAIHALQQAMTGRFMSLQYTYGIPTEAIAKAAGMSAEQLKESPLQLVKGMKSFVDEFVGADTMAMMAKNLGTQIGNLADKYKTWIVGLGKTGIYDKVIDYLLKLNEAQSRFFESEKMQRWTEQINKFLEEVFDRIAGVFTKGIDWESIMSLSQLGEAIKQVGRNAAEEFAKIWEVAKEPLAEAMKGVFRFVAGAAAEAFKEALWPAIKQQLREVGETFKTWDEYLREKMGAKLAPEAPEIGEWKGPRPWRERTEIAPRDPMRWAKWAAGYQPEKAKEAPVWMMKAESAFDHFSAWARMAKAIAEREEGAPTPFEAEQKRLREYMATREKWVTGEMPTEEWRGFMAKFDTETEKRMRLEDFAAQREKKLSGVLQTAITEKDVGVQGKVYGEMFNIALAKGDVGRAQDYMNKSLDAMVEQMKRADKFNTEDNQSLKDIKIATESTVEILKDWKKDEGRYSNIPGAEADETTESVKRAGIE